MSWYFCPCGCASTSYERDDECTLNAPLPVSAEDHPSIEPEDHVARERPEAFR